jgi:hypothetical protein
MKSDYENELNLLIIKMIEKFSEMKKHQYDIIWSLIKLWEMIYIKNFLKKTLMGNDIMVEIRAE